MIFEELGLESFKTVRDENVRLHKGLNIFIGKNNSGKSNLLESIIYFSPRGFKTDRLSAQDRSAKLSVSVRLNKDDQTALGVSSPKLELAHVGPGKRVYRAGGVEVSVDAVEKFFGEHVRHINTSLIFMEPESGWKTSGLIRRADLMKDVRVMKKKYPRAAAAFNRAMADCFPHVDAPKSSSITEHVRSARIVESDAKVQPQRMGMGYRQVFVMLFYVFFPETHVLMIDEPENHLHPHLQRKVLKYLQAETRRTQVLLSTHSPIFVDPHTIPHLFRIVRDAKGTHAHPKHHDTGDLDIERLVQEVNPESSEVLFADHVILVEGEADEIFLKRLIARFYKGHHDITVMAVHSNTNFRPIQQVLEYLEVPHTVMTDHDSLRGPIDVIARVIGRRKVSVKNSRVLQDLAEQGVVVLPFGELEHHYPRIYQSRKGSKTINALHAATNMTEREYHSKRMGVIRRLIDSL